MSNFVTIGILVLSTIFIFLVYNILNKLIFLKKSNFIIKEFVNYMSILKYFEEVAFDIVYKKEILVYSLDGWGVDNDVYKKAAKSFTELVLQLLGSRLTKELEQLHGSYKTLIDGICLYFYSRLESDEIRKLAVNDLLSEQETLKSAMENKKEDMEEV